MRLGLKQPGPGVILEQLGITHTATSGRCGHSTAVLVPSPRTREAGIRLPVRGNVLITLSRLPILCRLSEVVGIRPLLYLRQDGSPPMVGFSGIRHWPMRVARRGGSSPAILFSVIAGSAFLVTGALALRIYYGIVLDGTSPTMTGRIIRDGVPSTCAAVKTYPGDFGTTTVYRYR